MKSKMLLAFFFVALNGFVLGMDSYFVERSSSKVDKPVHEHSVLGNVIDHSRLDSQLPDDLKRGYDFKHTFEEWVVMNGKLIKRTNSCKTKKQNLGFKALLLPVNHSVGFDKSVLWQLKMAKSQSSSNIGSEIDSQSSFETVE